MRPDWVCEILSTNRRHDLHAKRRVLHDCGVPHDWIVDLDVPLLTVLRHATDGYLIAKTAERGERARLEPFDAILTGVNVSSSSVSDLFVVRLTSSGASKWAITVPIDSFAYDADIDGNDNAVVSFAQGTTGFVRKLAPSNGATLWTRSFTSAVIGGVAAGGSQNLVFASGPSSLFRIDP